MLIHDKKERINMISDEMKKIIQQYIEPNNNKLIKPATDEQIEAFEEKNGFSLPLLYKEWLSYSDGGDLFLPAGVQLYGVANKPLIDLDDESGPDDTYVVIGSLANGDPLLCNKNNQLISIFNQGAGVIEKDEVYDDFGAFLTDLSTLLGIEG